MGRAMGLNFAIKKRQNTRRANRVSCMVYPEDEEKVYWDALMAVVLIATCIVTPIRIAFYNEEETLWVIINYTIDILFLFDMFVIFNTAYYDEDFQIVDKRK